VLITPSVNSLYTSPRRCFNSSCGIRSVPLSGGWTCCARIATRRCLKIETPRMESLNARVAPCSRLRKECGRVAAQSGRQTTPSLQDISGSTGVPKVKVLSCAFYDGIATLTRPKHTQNQSILWQGSEAGGKDKNTFVFAYCCRNRPV
jgi:hypothetical protein